MVLADGQIKDITIVETSGRKVLDKATISAIELSSGLLPIPEDIERKEWVFSLSVAYKLN